MNLLFRARGRRRHEGGGGKEIMDIFIFSSASFCLLLSLARHEIRNIYEPFKSPKTDPIFTLLSPSHFQKKRRRRAKKAKCEARRLEIINYCSRKNFANMLRGVELGPSAKPGPSAEAIKGHLSKFNHLHLGMARGLKTLLFPLFFPPSLANLTPSQRRTF